MAKRKQIVWTPDVSNQQQDLKLNRFSPDIELTTDNVDMFANKLIHGGLFCTNCYLFIERSYDDLYAALPPFPYLIAHSKHGRAAMADTTIAVGSIAIYSGTIRVDEALIKSSRQKTLARANRHSFIIDSKRFLVRNLNAFTPLVID